MHCRIVGSALVIACLVLLGCGRSGPTLVKAGGRVTWHDQPVAQAIVSVMAPGRPGVGRTDDDGRFTLSSFESEDGVSPGTYKVTIIPHSLPLGAAAVAAELNAGGAHPTEKAPGETFPSRYWDMETSGLEAKIEAGGKNDFEFKLTD